MCFHVYNRQILMCNLAHVFHDYNLAFILILYIHLYLHRKGSNYSFRALDKCCVYFIYCMPSNTNS